MMKIAALCAQMGFRGLWQVGLYALQRRRSDRLFHLPIYAQIETTKGCNLRCPVCALSHYRVAAGHMSLEAFERVLNNLQGIQEVILQGLGEPLLNPAFLDIVRMAKARRLRVCTTTNGTRLTADIAVGLIDARLDLMSISMDGTTPDTYESIRHGATFESVIENVRRLAELKRDRGVDYPKLNVGYILTRRNYHQVPELVQLAAKMGVAEINVWSLHGTGTYANIDHLRLRDDDRAAVEQAFAEARRSATNRGIKLTLPALEPVLNAPTCEWPWRGTYVTWDGYVTSCCVMCYPELHSLGNLLEQGVHEIWNGPAYQQFRAALRGNSPPFYCRGCPHDVSWQAELETLPPRDC